MLKTKDEEINKAILEWLIIKNYTSAIDPFLAETGLKKEDATKGGTLEKKWGTILVMQSKVTNLENQVKNLKEELEKGGGGAIVNPNKVNENIVNIFS